MIPGSFFFAVAGSEIFYCRALAEGSRGFVAVCLNRNFEATIDADGYLLLPHAGTRRARIELIVDKDQRQFNARNHAEAIAYFLKRRGMPALSAR
jgi:hypothetical protein